MSIQNITVYTGDVPLIGQSQLDFDTNTGEILSYLATFSPQMNAVSTSVNSAVDTINSQATATANYALIAQGSANYKGDYSAGITYAQGDSVTDQSSGVDFVSKLDGNLGNSLFDNTYWKLATINAGAIGNINNPLLDLPLKNSLDMKQGVGSVAFTRASTATYIDRYGVMQTASIDEPRFEKEGLLIEGDSTNKCIYSEDFSNTSWLTFNTTKDSFAEVAPDGNDTATKITTSAQSSGLYRDGTAVSSGEVTTSHFVKKGVGTAILQIRDSINSANVITVKINIDTGVIESPAIGGDVTYIGAKSKLNINFWRLELSCNMPSTTTVTEYIYFDSIGSYTIFGKMTENLPFASSYIPTTTVAATRATEICSIPRDNNSIAGYGNSTTMIDFDLLGFNTTSVGNTIFDASTSLRLFVRGSTGSYFAREGTLASVETGLASVEKQRVGVVFEDGVLSIYSNGVLLSSVITEHETILSSNIAIGGSSLGWLFGHFSNYRTHDKALTPSEMAIA